MEKNNLGFILIDIENTAYYDNILLNIKKLIDSGSYNSVVIFSSNCNKIATYNIPIFHLSHAKFFDGTLWLFDVLSAIMARGFTNVKQRILYCNDMPWIKNRDTNYNYWKNIYDDIDYVTANQYLFDIYSLVWKKPLYIMENFDYEKIQQAV